MIRFFTLIGDLKHARAEIIRLKGELEVSGQELRTAEARLFDEIRVNRSREDGLVTIITNRDAAAPLPRRGRIVQIDDEPEVEEIPTISYDDDRQEQLIQKRAREFYEQAEAAGHEPVLEAYVAMLRAKPELLDN